MTKEEFRNYQAKLVDEILQTEDINVLNALRNVLKRYHRQSLNKVRQDTVSKNCKELNGQKVPCCYTQEEIRDLILFEIKLHQAEGFIIDNHKSHPQLTIKYSESAWNDKKTLADYYYKFTPELKSAIEVINFNTKTGKKDPFLSDIGIGEIRSIYLNKHCRLLYMIESPGTVLFLALQNSIIPLK